MHLILVRHLATSRFAALPAHLFLAAGCVLIVLLELVAPPFIDPRAAAFGARPCPTHHLTTTHQPAAHGCGVTDEQPCKRCHVYGAQRQRNFQLAVAACRAASCDVCVDEVPVHWNENAGTSSDSRTALVLVGAASSSRCAWCGNELTPRAWFLDLFPRLACFQALVERRPLAMLHMLWTIIEVGSPRCRLRLC